MSAFQALTRAKSPRIGSSSTYSRPSNSPRLLPFGDLGPDAGRRVEAADPGAPGAAALGQRPLRDQLDLQLARQVLLLEDLVLADVARDHLLDLLRRQQDAQSLVGRAAVVGDDRQPLDALAVQRGDQVLGVPAQAEPADDQRRAVVDVGDGGVGRLVHLPHPDLPLRVSARRRPPRPRRRRCRATRRRASSPGPSCAWSSVTRIRAPLAPIGWPSATAPPRTLTLLPSRPSSWLFAIETTAKASLISQRSTSAIASPARSSVRRIASAGAIGELARLAGGAAPGGDLRQDRAALAFGPLGAHQHQRRRAVVDARGVGGGDRAVLLEDRLEGRDLVRARGLRPLVLGDDGLLALPPLDLDRHDLGGEEAVLLGLDGAPRRLQRERVLHLARDRAGRRPSPRPTRPCGARRRRRSGRRRPSRRPA